jgi:Sodium/calcium exchanger protein
MRNIVLIAASALATVPGLALEWGAYAVTEAPLRALILGVAIVGAAFLLSWSAEVLQMDVSQGLALSLLAVIAVLPEYIVDATFAWKAAKDPAYAEYAVANMTGANRILIGVAWPMVVLLGWLRWRRGAVELERGHGLELVVLLAATLYAAIIPFKSRISLGGLRGAGGDVPVLRLAIVKDTRRAAASRGPGQDDRGSPARPTPRPHHRACGGGRGDRHLRGRSVRRRAARDRWRARHRQVPAGPVAGAAGV